MNPSKVEARDVLAKIEGVGQPVEFENCTIIGDLNLSSKIIYKQVYFNNSSFLGSINSNFTDFKSPVYFDGSNFGNNVYFRASNFNGTADFESASFNGNTDFSMANFEGNTDFSMANFEGNTDFSMANFEGNMDFSGDNFNGPVGFTRTKFNGEALFSMSSFNNISDFVYSLFNDSADFRLSQFNSSANFCHSKFNKKAFFYDAGFNGSTWFSQGEFDDDAYFDGAAFRGVLSLTRLKYNKLYIKLDDITQLEYDESTYQLLIENFKTLGYYDDADNGYYQFRVQRFLNRRPERDPLTYILDLGAWLFYGFGKKPLYPLCWSLGTVIFFGVFWRAMLKSKQESPSTMASGQSMQNSTDECSPAMEQDANTHKRRSNVWCEIHWALDPFSFSAATFLSSTRIFIEPPDIPKSLRWPRWLAKDMYTLERILGAFFSILFFLAIGGTIVR